MEVPTVIRTLRENSGEIEVKTASEARKWAIFVDYRQIIACYFSVMPERKFLSTSQGTLLR